MENSSKVSIKPGVNILGVFSKLNYRPWYAIAEFVDNAVSSYEFWEGPEKPGILRVEIDMDTTGTGRLEIRDNARGIAIEDFARAFKTAEIPSDRTKLNEFGMGMKTAAIWFARKWTVKTSTYGDAIERTVSIDIRDILENQLEEIDIVEAPSSLTSHFTTIRLVDLNNLPKGRSIFKIKEHLTSIYREFIRNGILELYFNGEKLKFEEPEVLEAARANSDSSEILYWKKEISILLPGLKKVTGWVGIRKIGSTTYAGLSIFRRGRLIEGSADETFRPEEIFGKTNSYRYQRIFGELHLEGFDVTHTKDSIQWDGLQELFLDTLREEISQEPLNLLYQAENLRKDTKPKVEDLKSVLSDVQHEIESGLPNSLREVESNAPDFSAPIPDQAGGAIVPQVQHSVTIDTGHHGLWRVNLIVHSDVKIDEWFQLGAQTEDVTDYGSPLTGLTVEVNLAHPFSQKYLGPQGENAALLISFASNLAVALTLGKRLGAKSAYIVDFLNAVLTPLKGIENNG